jgi:xanthine dehydrogenase accessory factor
MTRVDPDHAALIAALDEGSTLCTLVAVDGAFSRAPGAQLTVRANGLVAGDMTGGCLETALVSEAALARQDGCSRIVRYGKGSRYIDIRLPCGGGVDVLVDPVPDRADVRSVLASLATRRAAQLSLALGAGSTFERRYFPSPRLLLFGNGPEVAALSALAGSWGAEVDCIDLTLAGAVPPGQTADPWTAVIVLFHEHEWEDAILGWALAGPAFYIGALGGVTAVARRQTALRARGFDDAALRRVQGPVGLIPAARDVQMLAISILADVALAYGRITRRLSVPQ